MNTPHKDPSKHQEMRRQLLRAGALLAVSSGGIAHAQGAAASASVTFDNTTINQLLPNPAQSGIDHVIVVTMENRSFDHFFGWVPGANGRQSGLTFTDAYGQTRSSFALAADPSYGYQGCGHADPDHSYVGGRTQFNGGRCDGWLKTPGIANGDLFPIGYYTQNDLPFFAGCAQNWTICDQYMPGIMSETYPNRFYLLSGETDRLVNNGTTSQLPSIFDRFNDKGIPSKYYYSDIPFTALFGKRLLPNSFPYASFLADAKLGTLPAQSFIDPRFGGEGQGMSNDDHPVADIRNGQAFLNQVYDAVRSSPAWSRTLLVVVYDEWGGFYDHVAPIVRPISYNEKALGNDGRLGFRVPFVLIGPRVKRNHISSRQLDPSSLHSFLMWRFGIDPLGVRSTDKNTNSIAALLDFRNAPNLYAPAFGVPTGPFGTPCTGASQSNPSLEALAPLARKLGFPLL
ncbi:alkaline phosphatase family protein [Roseateles sp. GG27B]